MLQVDGTVGRHKQTDEACKWAHPLIAYPPINQTGKERPSGVPVKALIANCLPIDQPTNKTSNHEPGSPPASQPTSQPIKLSG